MSELKKGVGLNFVSMGLRLITGVLLTPYILECLGKNEYGLFVLVGSIIAWLALADFGLSTAVSKYVAEYRVKGEEKEQAIFLGSSMALYSFIALLVLSVGIVIYFKLAMIFPRLSMEDIDKLQIMYLLMLGNITMSFPLKAISGVPSAYGNFFVPNLINLIFSLLNASLTILLLYSGFKAVGLTVLSVAGNILMMTCSLVYVCGFLKAKVKWGGVKWGLYKKMFLFSFWVFLNTIMDLLYWRAGNTIIAMTATMAQVTLFAVGIQFSQYFMMASGSIASVFFAKIVGMVTLEKGDKELTALMARVGRIQLMILMLLMLGFLVYGQAFLKLWVGHTLGEDYIITWWVALIVLMPLVVPLIQNLGIQILQAKDMHKARAIILIISSILSIGIGYILSFYYGAIGFAIGTGISLLLGQGFLLNYYYHKYAGLNMKVFFSNILSRIYLIIIPPLGVAYVLNIFIELNNWCNLGIACGIFSVVYLLCVRLFYMRPDEVMLLPRKLRFCHE